jgi:hypothetical protein
VATKQKEEKRRKPKPEEQEGMPQRQHCPYEVNLLTRNKSACFYLYCTYDEKNLLFAWWPPLLFLFRIF